MASKNTNRKPNRLQVVDLNPYDTAMRKLGLDWPAIDQITEQFTDTGDDEHLVLAIVLLQRLANLSRMRGAAPESLENFLPLLIDRLYRGTIHCEHGANHFAESQDAKRRSA